MSKKEEKVIYLKALFKKHKGTERLDKLIKHFIIMNKGFVVENYPNTSNKDKSKEVKSFIVNNVEDFLGYAIDYSMYDKYFEKIK
jgi:hypothetical protein